MIYFISYDIRDCENRNAVAWILECSGRRIQYSLFQCELNRDEVEYLFEKLCAYIDPNCDRLHFYPVCKKCFEAKIILGTPASLEEQAYAVF